MPEANQTVLKRWWYILKSVTKNTPESSKKKKNTEDWKRILELSKAREVILRNINWSTKTTEFGSIRLSAKIMETHKFKKIFFSTYKNGC